MQPFGKGGAEAVEIRRGARRDIGDALDHGERIVDAMMKFAVHRPTMRFGGADFVLSGGDPFTFLCEAAVEIEDCSRHAIDAVDASRDPGGRRLRRRQRGKFFLGALQTAPRCACSEERAEREYKRAGENHQHARRIDDRRGGFRRPSGRKRRFEKQPAHCSAAD